MKPEKLKGLQKMFEGRGEPAKQYISNTIAEYEDRLRAPFLPPARLIKLDESVKKTMDVVVPCDVLDHFIRKAGHIVIAHSCACRVAEECKNFPIDLGCMFLGEPSKKLPSSMVRSATVEEALAHARKLQDAGLVLHLGFVPYDAKMMGFVEQADHFMSICGCCPCCSISRFVQYQRMPGVEIQVSASCTACGACVVKCPSSRIEIIDGKKVVDAGCLACGWCVESCPEGAIALKVTDPDLIRKTIDWISEKVDVT